MPNVNTCFWILAGIGHKQGSQNGPFSVQVKMTDLCLIQGREKFVSYWKRQKSPGCFHFVILQQKSGLCQYKSMSPAHSCHTELTLFTVDIKAFHFQILSNGHLWMGAECGKRQQVFLTIVEERQDCLKAAEHLWCGFHHWAAKSGVCDHLKSLKENALTIQPDANHEPEFFILLEILLDCIGLD